MVLLDGCDVVMTYQPILDLPAAQVRVGLRVEARWASPEETEASVPAMGGAGGFLLGWAPTGEPDATDKDLVNRIF